MLSFLCKHLPHLRTSQKRQPKTDNLKPTQGFTLIELVLSIALIGIMAGLVGPMLTNGIKSYAMVASRKTALGQVRLSMERIAYEIRLIPNTASIDIWTGSAIQFDLPTEANISYSLTGSNLMRSGVVIADNVTVLTFSYYDSSGNPAAAVGDIYRIRFEITQNTGNGFGSITVRNTVFPRRLATAYANFQ